MEKRDFFSFLITLLTVLIFVFLFSRINLFDVIKTIRGASIVLLLLAIALSILIKVFVASHKLGIVLKSMGSKISLREIIFARLGSYPIKFLLPLQSGKFLKTAYFKKYCNVSIKKATSAVLFDLMSDFYSLLLLFLISLNFSGIGLIYKEYVTALGVLCLLITFFFFRFVTVKQLVLNNLKKISTGLYTLFRDIFAAFEEIEYGKKIIIILYSVILNSLILLTYYVLFNSVYAQIPFLVFMTYMSLVILISQIPVSISGLGVREISIVLLLKEYASPEKLLGSGLLVSFVDYVLPLCLALFFMKPFLHKLILEERA